MILPFSKKPAVQVLHFSGQIGSGKLSIDSTRKNIDKAFGKEPDLVALVVNSPGGSPVESKLIHDYIREKADKKKTPVISFIKEVGASGGYWIAMAGDKVYAYTDMSIVGSIGVVGAMFNFKDLIERHGIERVILTAGNNKSRLDPFMELKEEDKEWVQAIQGDIHQKFKSHVIARRKTHGTDLTGRDDLFQGDWWLADKAVELGLIDGIQTLSSYLDKEFPKAKVNHLVTEPKGIARKLMAAGIETFGDAVSLRVMKDRFGGL